MGYSGHFSLEEIQNEPSACTVVDVVYRRCRAVVRSFAWTIGRPVALFVGAIPLWSLFLLTSILRPFFGGTIQKSLLETDIED
jgi:hypothetical protein